MDLSPEDEGIIVAGRAFVKLLESPHWPMFREAIERRIAMEARGLVRRSRDLGDVFAMESQKGLIEGLSLALEMPVATVEEMKRLQALKYSEDEQDG